MYVAVVIACTSCHPLDKTYKTLDENPVPVAAKSLTYTLVAADYKLLPSTAAANKSGNFTSVADANANIPTILNSKFPFGYGDGSNASITYTSAPITVKPADSLFADVAYTLTHDDYLLLPKNTFTDFSTAQILSWLPYKYPTPVDNQLAVLSYSYFQSGVTPNSGVPRTDSFLYLNGAWIELYTISAAQYASIGHGNFNEIVAADLPTLPATFNTFLKADPTVAATAKAGNVIYVSYNYFASKVDYQRVLPLTFDGTNWVSTPVTLNTLTFVKAKGSWAPDPTIFYTTVAADYTLVGNSTLANATARSNYAQFGDFNIQTGSQYFWSQDDINSALILVLQARFPSPQVNIPYHINYLIYTGTTSSTFAVFIYDGSTWKLKTS